MRPHISCSRRRTPIKADLPFTHWFLFAARMMTLIGSLTNLLSYLSVHRDSLSQTQSFSPSTNEFYFLQVVSLSAMIIACRQLVGRI